MTAVTLVIRYVSVSFNVYLTNKIGAVAMGLFTLISSVYGFALTLATSGLSLATTKLVSEAMGAVEECKQASTVKSIMKKSLLFAFLISLSVSIGLYLLSPILAKSVLKDEFPKYADISLEMPDESNRRVGQSIAAASLPKIK